MKLKMKGIFISKSKSNIIQAENHFNREIKNKQFWIGIITGVNVQNETEICKIKMNNIKNLKVNFSIKI